MKRWSFRAVVTSLAAPAIFALALLFLLGAASTGALWVSTLPSGADVWLDGTYVGRSPLVVDALAAGEHKLTLTRTGWNPLDVSATVLAAQTATAAVVLTRGSPRPPGGTGTIAIHGPRPASISVDGEPTVLPKDGTITVAAGTHELLLGGSPGRTTRSVTVYPQTRTDVVISSDAEPRSAVIAAAEDYLPAGSIHIEGPRVTVRFAGHDVVARIGTSDYRVDRKEMSYDAAPTLINGRLYLPIDLLLLLNPQGGTKK
jgi:hypothetical protein